MLSKETINEIINALHSSLDFDKSLHETFLLLKDHFPLDLIHVFILDRSTKTMRYLAEATQKSGILIDERLHLGDKHIKEIDNQDPEKVRVLTSSKSPLLRTLHSHFLGYVKKPLFKNSEDFSVLTMGFDIVEPLIGGIGLVVRGKSCFTPKHISQLKQIRRPMIGAVLNLLHHRDLVAKNEQLIKEKQVLESKLGHTSADEIIGAESGLKHVSILLEQVASLDSPVLILGETGTGKELVANAIHKRSGRADGPIIRVNCGAIPESLIDSELFGHEKGAFTGATQLKRGYFEQADGGTIFLDEIGELPLAAQVKLLRVLQTLEFQRIGGAKSVSVNVRVVAATNRNLSEMVIKNKFRQDLWFRLNVFPIRIPPLRERIQDIGALSLYFIKKKSSEMNMKKSPTLTQTALRMLKRYTWPGNIRELQNVIERALIIGLGDKLKIEDVIPKTTISNEELIEEEENERFLSMDEMIKQHISSALNRTAGKIEGLNGAANLLKMHPSTLRSRMKKLGIIIKKSVSEY